MVIKQIDDALHFCHVRQTTHRRSVVLIKYVQSIYQSFKVDWENLGFLRVCVCESNEVVWFARASSCPHTDLPRVFTWIYHGTLRSSVFIPNAVFIEDAISVVQPDDAGRPADSTAPVQTQTVFLDVHFILPALTGSVALPPPSIWNLSKQTSGWLLTVRSLFVIAFFFYYY